MLLRWYRSTRPEVVRYHLAVVSRATKTISITSKLLLCWQVLQRGGEHDRGGLLPAHALHLHPHQQEEGEDAGQGQQEVQGEGDEEDIDGVQYADDNN